MRKKYSLCFSGGHSIAEYALLLFLLTLVSIPALNYLGETIEALYSQNDPVSRAGDLFALLGGSSGAQSAAAPAAGGDTGDIEPVETMTAVVGEAQEIIAENQPVADVALDFDGSRVKVLDGAGTPATSADGTKILAQNIKEIIKEIEPALDEEQKEVVTRLADLGDAIAESEEYLIKRYPGIESANPPNIAAFADRNTRAGAAPSEYLHADYLAFKDEYAKLDSAFKKNQDNPVLNAAKKEIDANAGTISQLAYYNFLNPQAEIDQHRKSQIDSNKITAGVDVTKCKAKKTSNKDNSGAYVGTQTDISGITVAQSPIVTTQSSEKIRVQERKCWWNQVK